MSHLYRSAVFLFAIAGRPLAQAPAPRAVPDEPSCSRCTISMQKLVTLGTNDGVGSLIGKPMSVNVDSRGRYWVFQELEPPTVFHSDGRVDRVIGRKGSGPGEFRSGNIGIVVGDSMLVLDWQELRATMMGPDLKAGRQIRLRYGLHDLVVLRWPTLIANNGHMIDARPANSTIHLLSMANEETNLVSSFGPTGLGGSMGHSRSYQLLAKAKDGLWSVLWNRPPHITKWSVEGKPNQSLTRRYDWFNPEVRSTMGTKTTPPTPSVGLLAEDAEGLIWLHVHRPAPTWKEGWPSQGIRMGGGVEFAIRDMGFDKLYTTHLDVIDPANARVVASHHINGYVFGSLPGGRVALYRVDEDGIPRVDIAILTLNRR